MTNRHPGLRAGLAAALAVGLVLMTTPRADAACDPARAAGDPQRLATSPLDLETRDGTHRLTVELAETERERAVGLMFRPSMPDGHGMLFRYPRAARVSMWMKNTCIPLDILFIRGDGSIANIARNTVPYSLDSIASKGRVVAVLELNAGAADALGIAPGDRVRHAIFGNGPDQRP